MQAIMRHGVALAATLMCAVSAAAQETSLRPQARPAAEASKTVSTNSPVAETSEAEGPFADLRPVARADAARAQGVSEAELLAPLRPLAQAMALVRSSQFAAALEVAGEDGPVAVDIVEWHRLRAGQGTPDEVMAFLRRNGDWPGLPFLRRKSEPNFLGAGRAVTRAFFEGQTAQTAAGAFALAVAQGGAEGRATAVAGWQTHPMPSALQARYLETFGDALAPHHATRLDAMLWEEATNSAGRMLPLVDEEARALAGARLAYLTRAGDVAAKLEAVPEDLRATPGLQFARFDWMTAKRQRARSIEVMLEASESAEALGVPEAWAPRRRVLVRQELRAGRFQSAYDLAAPHFLENGTAYSDLEWLAGYAALRLGRAGDALKHFDRLDANVASPISKGRAGYWRGRAYEAMGEEAAAQAAYADGAAFQTSFYGLLAAEKAGIAPPDSLAGREDFPPWQDAPFRQTSVFRAAILLLASDEDVLAERFFTHLTESLDRTEAGQLGDLLMVLETPHIQVMVGKRAAQAGLEIPGPYYALHPVAEMDHPVPAELVLAISRRESEFDPVVISGAGARGLMQLMPGTARDVSRDLGMPYGRDRLLTDFEYNATLGAKYLEGLARRFDGNIVMMAAGYNAGPGRPIQWMERNGDPRRGGIDIVDWIELIPFTETRNYVMRVTESLPVYRARLGKDPLPVPFSEELVGSTMR
ncbi:transglycosylase SLT domain-containing protein [Pseudaestuariivita sp.]|uniref:transglycosylase SLT domain-containing protein n=1 Tax=Pseudaestuariivita sp. TaxID=2211669 RepID=UPI00405A0D47